jgi:hypothetical protein
VVEIRAGYNGLQQVFNFQCRILEQEEVQDYLVACLAASDVRGGLLMIKDIV